MIRVLKFLFGGNIAKTTLKTSALLGIRLAIQTTTVLLLAQLLGANQFGTYAAITSVALLMGIVSLCGMNFILLRDSSLDSQQIQITLRYAIPSILLLSFFSIALFLTISSYFFNGSCPEIMPLLMVGISEIIVFPLLLLLSSYHQANNRILLSQLITIIPLFARLILIVFLFNLDPKNTLNTLFIGYFLVAFISLIFAYNCYRPKLPHINSWRLPSIRELKELTKYSALNFSSLSLGEIDKTLTIHLLSGANAGIYAMATRIVGAATLPIGALIVTTTPKLFQRKENNRNLIKKIFISSLIFSFLAMLAIKLCSSTLEKLFPSSFSGMADSLVLMSIAIPAVVLRMIASNILITKNMVSVRLINEATGMGLLMLLLIALSGLYGINGAIFSLIIAETVMAIVGWIAVTIKQRE